MNLNERGIEELSEIESVRETSSNDTANRVPERQPQNQVVSGNKASNRQSNKSVEMKGINKYSDSSVLSKESSNPANDPASKNNSKAGNEFSRGLWESIKNHNNESRNKTEIQSGKNSEKPTHPGQENNFQNKGILNGNSKTLPEVSAGKNKPVMTAEQQKTAELKAPELASMLNGGNSLLPKGENNPGFAGKDIKDKSVGAVSSRKALNPSSSTPRRGVTGKPWGNLFSKWSQGKEGNCASVATIKAAMDKYGGKIFKKVERSGDGYKIKMKDGKTVNLKDSELKTASRMSRFKGAGKEKDVANFCYAAMAKRALNEGHEGAKTYARACHSLNNGENPYKTARFLGLKNNVKSVRNPGNLKSATGAVGWSKRHAVYISGGRTDHYGQARAYNGTDTRRTRTSRLTGGFVLV